MIAMRKNHLYLMLTVFVLTGCQTVPGSNPTKELSISKKLSEVPRVTPTEVKALLDTGVKVMIVDTRTRDEYDELHIQGAAFLADVQARYNELAKDTRFVFY